MDLDVTTQKLIAKIDDLEDRVALASKVIKEYDNLKSQLKEKMLEIGHKNNLEQVKWITPNGTTITCSIGHFPKFEKQVVREFDIETLQEQYPDIYESCCFNIEREVMIEKGSNDILRITPKKED